MKTSRLWRTPGVLVAAAALLAGCTGGSGGTDEPDAPPVSVERQQGTDKVLEALPSSIPASLERYYQQKLSWRDCGAEGFECATLKVPMDYEKPGSTKDLELSVLRKNAEGSRKPIASLVVNPGGPGGSAVDYVQLAAGIAFPEEVRQRYDIVGMDPRGVARSEPIKCLSGARMDRHTAVDLTPDDEAETAKLVKAKKEFAEACRKQAGKLLDHVSTVESARDMDVLRAALGDRKLHYVGFSYGTYLGATYAGLFPSRSGRLVLDGGMDPSLNAEQLGRDQTAGFNTALTAFAQDCVKRSDCPLGTKDAEDAGRQLSKFFQQVDREPLKTDDPKRELTESLATNGVILAMYDESMWVRLRDALKAAKKGDGAPLLALSDNYYERDTSGNYGNIMYANAAINCLDQPAAFGAAEDAEKAVESYEKVSPVFGRGFAYDALTCADWTAEPSGEANRVEAKGAEPILVVGTTRDPATPYVWSESLAEQLASATLLTYDGDGHTAYVRGGDCVNETVNAYLLKGEMPEKGKRCT